MKSRLRIDKFFHYNRLGKKMRASIYVYERNPKVLFMLKDYITETDLYVIAWCEKLCSVYLWAINSISETKDFGVCDNLEQAIEEMINRVTYKYGTLHQISLISDYDYPIENIRLVKGAKNKEKLLSEGY